MKLAWVQILISLALGFALGFYSDNLGMRGCHSCCAKKEKSSCCASNQKCHKDCKDECNDCADCKGCPFKNLGKDLGLTTEQETKLSAIFDEKRKKKEELFTELKPKIEVLYKETDEKIKAILNEEQKVKFEKLIASWEEKRD